MRLRHMIRHVLAAALAFSVVPTTHGLVLSDAAVFSSNPQGQHYNGLIWNTVGQPPDTNNRWNLYFSSSTDILAPVFLNDENIDALTSLSIALTPGVHRFGIYADAAGSHTDHFALSLYFGGDRNAPLISAAAPVGGGPLDFVVASHPDGLGLVVDQGNVANAGVLSFVSEGLQVTLTEYFFSTDTDDHPDLVWPHNQRHDFGPSPSGNDFYGQIALRVTPVPEPSTLALLGLGLTVFAWRLFCRSSRALRRAAINLGAQVEIFLSR